LAERCRSPGAIVPGGPVEFKSHLWNQTPAESLKLHETVALNPRAKEAFAFSRLLW